MLKRKYVLDSKSNMGERKKHFHEDKSQSRRSSSNDSPVQARYNRSISPELNDWKRPKTTNTVQGLKQKERHESRLHSGAMLKRRYVLDSKSNIGERKKHHEIKSRSRRSSSNDSPVQARYNRSSSPELYNWKRPKTTNTVQGLKQRERHESRRSTADKRSRGHDIPEREEHSPKHSTKKVKYVEYERIPNSERHAWGQLSPDRKVYAEKYFPPDREYVSRSDWGHYSPPNKVQTISTDEKLYYSAPARERLSLPDKQNDNITADREDNYSASDRAFCLLPHRDQYSSSYGKDYTDSQRSSGKESHSGGRNPPVVSQRDTQNDRMTVDYDTDWKQISDRSYTLEPQSSGKTLQLVGLKPHKGRDDDARDGDTGQSDTSYSIDLINLALVSASFLIGV